MIDPTREEIEGWRDQNRYASPWVRLAQEEDTVDLLLDHLDAAREQLAQRDAEIERLWEGAERWFTALWCWIFGHIVYPERPENGCYRGCEKRFEGREGARSATDSATTEATDMRENREETVRRGVFRDGTCPPRSWWIETASELLDALDKARAVPTEIPRPSPEAGRQPMAGDPSTYRTKLGRVLTDADIESLADEAERGYDVEHLPKRPGRPLLGAEVESYGLRHRQERQEIKSFHEAGLLWLVNTAILHPRGYALAIAYDDTTEPDLPTSLRIVGSDEPWCFAPHEQDDVIDRYEAAELEREQRWGDAIRGETMQRDLRPEDVPAPPPPTTGPDVPPEARPC